MKTVTIIFINIVLFMSLSLSLSYPQNINTPTSKCYKVGNASNWKTAPIEKTYSSWYLNSSYNKKQNTNQTYYALDKVNVDDSMTTSYKYKEGRLASVLNENSNNGVTINSWRYTYTYNDKTVIEVLDEGTNGDWENVSRITRTYNADGNLYTYFKELWQNDAWVNYERYCYSYNNNGDKISWYGEFWNVNMWDPSWRNTYSYDNNKKLISDLREEFEYGWEIVYKNLYIYEDNDKKQSIVTYFWQQGDWKSDHRLVYIYNDNGKKLFRGYDIIYNGGWEGSIADSFYYDNKGYLILATRDNLMGAVSKNRDSYTYDNYGNLTQQLNEIFTNGIWSNNTKCLIGYNEGNAKSCESYKWLNNEWVKQYGLLPLYYNNGQGYEMFYGSVAEVSYTQLTAVENNIQTVEEYNISQNYPNPFNPSTTIRYQLPKAGLVTIKVYDILGSEIKTLVNEYKQSGNYSVNFDASKLSSGVYIYKITAGDYIASKKMILIK